MKRTESPQRRRLHLTRETVRRLTSVDLQRIHGGASNADTSRETSMKNPCTQVVSVCVLCSDTQVTNICSE
jgi:uncharacterized protein related to proFAR isomerase